MVRNNFTTTTFHYDKDKHWRFKNVVTSQKKTVKEVCTQLFDRTIEDAEDLMLRDEILNNIKENSGWQIWVTMKRRMGLDASSSHN